MTDNDYGPEHDKWVYIWRYDDIRLARASLLWAICALGLWLLTRIVTG